MVLRLAYTTYHTKLHQWTPGEWFPNATPSFLDSQPSSLPSRTHIHTPKCTTEFRQKSNKSIGDRRNLRATSNTHLKTSISSRLSSLLSFLSVVSFKHYDNRCLWVPSWAYSADCAHLPYTTCDFGRVCLDISEYFLYCTHLCMWFERVPVCV